jgi:hypothetical protein
MQRLFSGCCQRQQTDFMKKGLNLLLLACSLLTLVSSCDKESDKHPYGDCIPELPAQCYKGRLEIMGICGNYTIKLLEGNIDSNLIQKSWVNPVSGMTHTNVFALENTCDFPRTLKEGDEFYFQIRSNEGNNCSTCLATYPKPDKKLSIQIQTGSCNDVSTQ